MPSPSRPGKELHEAAVLCRTPQGVRALLLVYIMLIEPLFFGPYYAFVRQDVSSFAFALFFAIVVGPARCAAGDIESKLRFAPSTR